MFKNIFAAKVNLCSRSVEARLSNQCIRGFSTIIDKLKHKDGDLNSMHSKVSKFMKPNKPQEYFEQKIVQAHYDKKHYDLDRNGKLGPTKPLYPDEKQGNDYNFDAEKVKEIEKDEKKFKIRTFNDYFDTHDKTVFSRLREQIHLAGEITKKYSNPIEYSKLQSASESLKTETTESVLGIYKETIYNIENEDHEASDISDPQIREKLHEVMSKLGYLDYREFLALNKYILEDSTHKNLIDKTKKNIMIIVMDLLDEKRRDELRVAISKIERQKGIDQQTRDDSKLDYMFANIKGSAELFYKYYYILKQQNREIEYKYLSQYEKIQELKDLNKIEDKDLYEYQASEMIYEDDPILNNKKFDFNSSLDKIIRVYRKQRLRKIDIDSKRIIKKVCEVFKFEDIPETIEQVQEALDNQEAMKEEKRKQEAARKAAELEAAKIQSAKEAEARKNQKKNPGGKESVIETSVIPQGLDLSMLRTRRKFKKKRAPVDENGIKYLKKKPENENKKNEKVSKIDEDELHCNNEIKKGDADLNEEEKNLTSEDFEYAIKTFLSTEAFAKSEKKEEIILFMKYLVISEKLANGLIYEPTNIDTEKKIYNYLKSKLENREYDIEELTSNDPFINALKISSNDNESDSFLFKHIDNTKTDSKTLPFIEVFKKIKNNYINSKGQYEKEKLIQEFDHEYAKQFGFVNSQKLWDAKFKAESKDSIVINNQVFPSRLEIKTYNDFTQYQPLIKGVLNNYYKDYKLNFMYNYMDYFTNKYQVRRKLKEHTANRVSLREINHLITKLAYDTVERNKSSDKLDFTNQILLNFNNGKINDLVNIFEVIEEQQQNKSTLDKRVYNSKNGFEPILPKQIEQKFRENPLLFDHNSKDSIITKMMTVKNEFNPSYHDKFEVEMYTQLNKDPFFRHHMQTFFSFQSDKHNNFAEFSNINSKVSKLGSKSLYSFQGDYPNSNIMSRYMDDFSNEHMQKYYDVSKRVKEINTIVNKEKIENSFPLENIEYESLLDQAQAGVDSANESKKISLININTNEALDVFRNMKSFAFTGFGKRKTAVAQATISPGTGKITINGKPFHHYFNLTAIRYKVMIPLVLSRIQAQINVNILVYGGGLTGQSEAIIPAISKAIIKLNGAFENLLRDNILVSQDPRNVERKKRGLQKARKGQVYNRR